MTYSSKVSPNIITSIPRSSYRNRCDTSCRYVILSLICFARVHFSSQSRILEKISDEKSTSCKAHQRWYVYRGFRMMTSVTSRATFQNSDVIFIWLDISYFEKKFADYVKNILYLLCYLFYLLKSWLRIKNNKDIKAFQIKIDEQTHRIQISRWHNSKNDISITLNEIEVFFQGHWQIEIRQKGFGLGS
jgi:hypothetical protein